MIWLIVVMVFGVLILVHEMGHLIAAKRAGIAVEAFSLGMGKRLFGVKIGETDYRISLIPFGFLNEKFLCFLLILVSSGLGFSA